MRSVLMWVVSVKVHAVRAYAYTILNTHMSVCIAALQHRLSCELFPHSLSPRFRPPSIAGPHSLLWWKLLAEYKKVILIVRFKWMWICDVAAVAATFFLLSFARSFYHSSLLRSAIRLKSFYVVGCVEWLVSNLSASTAFRLHRI